METTVVLPLTDDQIVILRAVETSAFIIARWTEGSVHWDGWQSALSCLLVHYCVSCAIQVHSLTMRVRVRSHVSAQEYTWVMRVNWDAWECTWIWECTRMHESALESESAWAKNCCGNISKEFHKSRDYLLLNKSLAECIRSFRDCPGLFQCT